jgi:hypothetical protein
VVGEGKGGHVDAGGGGDGGGSEEVGLVDVHTMLMGGAIATGQ